MPTLRALVLSAAALASFSAPATISTATYFDSFEDQSFPGWTPAVLTGSSIAASNAGAVWDGTRALQISLTPPVAPGAELSQWFQTPLSAGFILMFWVYLPPGTGAHLNAGDEVKLIDLRNSVGGTLMYVSLGSGLKNSQKVLFAKAGWGSTGTIGSADLSQLTEGTWHYLEFDYAPSDVATLEVDDALAYRDLKATSGQQMGVSSIAIGAAGGSLGGSGQITYSLDGLAIIDLGAPNVAIGQVSIPRHADEFESSGLLLTDNPPGKWAWWANEDAGVSEQTSRAAAHRGDGGVRFASDGGTNATPQLNALYGSVTETHTMYRRVWWRSGSTGSRALVGILGSTLVGAMAPRITAAMATLEVTATGDVLFGGLGADGGTTVTTTQTVFTPGDNLWHLLELAVSSPDAGGGRRVGYFDGKPVGSSDGGWRGTNLADGFALGELPGISSTGTSAAYAGVDDFDDDRTAAEMQPSRLAVGVSPSPIDPGVCTSVTVQAMASDNTLAAVPESTTADLVTTPPGAGTFYVGDCSGSAVPQITLPAGATSFQGLYFKAASTVAGTVSLEARNVDYLQAPAQVTVNGSVLVAPDPPIVPLIPVGAGPMPISWIAVVGATSYDLRLSTDGGKNWTTFATGLTGGASSYVTEASGNYVFSVCATYASAQSSCSSASQNVVVDLQAPYVPLWIKVDPQISNGQSATVSWGLSTDPYPSAGFKGYNLTVIDPSGVSTTSPLDTTSWPFRATTEGIFRFQVTAEDMVGNVSAYAETTATVDLTAPSTPTGLHASVTGGTVSLAWEPSTDATAITYSVEEFVGTSFTQVGTTAVTTFQVPGPLPPGRYRFRVQAQDAGGNLSAYSTELVVAISGPPSALRLSMNPKGRVNQPMDVTVSMVDSLGMTAPSYTGTVTFDPIGGVSLPAAYTFSAADLGIHTFAGGVTAANAGTDAITARAPNLGTGFATVTVEIVSATATMIIHDASPLATVSAPYEYNDTRHITVEGVPPFVFKPCQDGRIYPMAVDQDTGLVTWTPATNVETTLCVQVEGGATGDRTTDLYSFVVHPILLAPSTLPAAAAKASPPTGIAPLDTVLDGSDSTADPLAYPMSFQWLFGDGTASGISNQAAASHRYAIPGAYRPALVARDGFGRLAPAKTSVAAAESAAHGPPAARIVRLPVDLATGKFSFSCECTPPDAGALVYLWDLGDGSHVVDSPTPSNTYNPGRYRVTLVVADRQGAIARDSIEIAVGPPASVPMCQAWVEPATFGVAPFSAVLHASVRAGAAKIQTLSWKIDENEVGQAPNLPVSIGPGWHQASLEVKDSAGVVCRDTVTIIGTSKQGMVPPKIVSLNTGGAKCYTPFTYSPELRPVATGTAPFDWSLDQAPAGATVNALTGELAWTPKSAQTVNFNLTAKNAAGKDSQSFNVTVDCNMDVNLNSCGCGASGMSGPVAAAGLILLALRWRRRSRRAAPPASM